MQPCSIDHVWTISYNPAEYYKRSFLLSNKRTDKPLSPRQQADGVRFDADNKTLVLTNG